MTRVNIPIRLRFLRIPAAWELRTLEGRTGGEPAQFAFSQTQDDGSLDAFPVSELDAWKCRDQFFDMREGDNDALLKFLAKVGVWLQMEGEMLDHSSKAVIEHYRGGHPVPIDIRGLWKFREKLRDALVNKKSFRETYAPLLSRPETGLQLVQESGGEFNLRLEITNVATGVVTLTDAYHALLATVFFDVARGVRFKTCERVDCGKPFPLESKHKRKFCSWYCAHITTVRRNRPQSDGKKKAGKTMRHKASRRGY